MKCYMRVLLSLTLVLALLIPAYAAITGTISGTVTDQSGAAVPGVTVVALNEETGVQQTITTDSSGFYSFLALGVGSYTISASQPGFETLHETGIKVDANSSIRTDVRLKVGATLQTELVQSNAVQVETQSTQLGEVISSARITSVPLNGRSYTDLLALQPGGAAQ